MKIYMVEANWYDDCYEENVECNIAAFTSVEAAQQFINHFSEVDNEESDYIRKILDENGFDDAYKTVDSMKTYANFTTFTYAPYGNKITFWIYEYDLKG